MAGMIQNPLAKSARDLVYLRKQAQDKSYSWSSSNKTGMMYLWYEAKPKAHVLEK